MKIIDIEPSPTDPCSFYRGREPLSRLSKENDIHIITANRDCQWDILCLGDILFFSRPHLKSDYELILKAKNIGLSVWVDFDDNFFDIPNTNPAHVWYTDSSFLIEIIKVSDIVTVTNEQMKSIYGKYSNNVIIIPNCLNDYIHTVEMKKHFSGKKETFWRGSGMHEADLFEYYAPLLPIMSDNTKWKFNFMTENLFQWQKLYFYDNINHIKSVELFSYFLRQREVNASLSLVPLSDNIFNHCKSNISWIESTYSGSTCIIPNFGSFEKCPGLHYNSVDEFGEMVNKGITFECDLNRMNALSWEKIQDELLLSKVNKKRLDIINILNS